MKIKITHVHGYMSAIDTYISTEIASFNIFTIIKTRGNKVASISAVKGWREGREIERFSDAEFDSGVYYDGEDPYRLVRQFWAKCLAERFAGVDQ